MEYLPVWQRTPSKKAWRCTRRISGLVGIGKTKKAALLDLYRLEKEYIAKQQSLSSAILDDKGLYP